MIGHLLEEGFVVLSYPFWGTVLKCSTRLLIHILNDWTVQSVVPVF